MGGVADSGDRRLHPQPAAAASPDATGGIEAEGDEFVVVRLEGLGTFAVPVTVLSDHRVAAAGSDPMIQNTTVLVPVVLGHDFLRVRTSEPDTLSVDSFGNVRCPDGASFTSSPDDPLDR